MDLLHDEITDLWIVNLPQGPLSDILGKGGSLTKLTKEFVESRLFHWLQQLLSNNKTGYTNFGWLTMNLQQILLDDPKPYRKEIKDYVSYIFDWLENSNQSKISVQHHKHTSSLRLNQ